MTNPLAAAGQERGGIARVVLGHSHPDHRGAAAGLRVPVWCHSAERVDAESDGGAHYLDFSRLRPPARWVMPRLLQTWDGGPVQIERTLEEGDEVAGFRVVHLPGHAPGMIALWRESDRLALTLRLLLHARRRDEPDRPAARPARRLQPGHRAGARVGAQARRARAGHGLARPRRPGDRRRARTARSRGRWVGGAVAEAPRR